ncbi:MAG: hypothetical protein KGP28_02650 [Bdellovibrionales bacterium]|nr:hypothetical protein [Bdellovibrionales bacterium]
MSRRSVVLILFFCVSCVSVPERTNHPQYLFPEKWVYTDLPTGAEENRPYKILGWVRAKTDWPTLDQDGYSQSLCKNYFNKASASLLKEAKKVGADAVIQVRSVVFTLDGRTEEHSTPECSDDGAVGEVLLRGIAIKFKPLDEKRVISR